MKCDRSDYDIWINCAPENIRNDVSKVTQRTVFSDVKMFQIKVRMNKHIALKKNLEQCIYRGERGHSL
jgi:hypothetical protein